MRPATVEGSPKTPLPMMEFTTSATRLQRPITRTSPSPGGLLAGYSIRAFVSQNEDARTTVTAGTQRGDLGAIVDCTIGCDRMSRASAPLVRSRYTVKSLASSGVYRHCARMVTLQTKVIA